MTVRLTVAEFEALPDYSCSVPTGFTAGKRWTRREPYQTGPGVEHTYWLGEYVEDNEGRHIAWEEIEVVSARDAQIAALEAEMAAQISVQIIRNVPRFDRGRHPAHEDIVVHEFVVLDDGKPSEMPELTDADHIVVIRDGQSIANVRARGGQVIERIYVDGPRVRFVNAAPKLPF